MSFVIRGLYENFRALGRGVRRVSHQRGPTAMIAPPPPTPFPSTLRTTAVPRRLTRQCIRGISCRQLLIQKNKRLPNHVPLAVLTFLKTPKIGNCFAERPRSVLSEEGGKGRVRRNLKRRPRPPPSRRLELARTLPPDGANEAHQLL